MRHLIGAFVILLIIIGCAGEESPVEVTVPEINVDIPEEISLKQPVKIVEPLEVIIINTEKVRVSVVAVYLYRSNKIGMYYLFINGNINNTTRKTITINVNKIDIKINRKNVDIDMAAVPDAVPSDTTLAFWFYTTNFTLQDKLTYFIDFNL